MRGGSSPVASRRSASAAWTSPLGSSSAADEIAPLRWSSRHEVRPPDQDRKGQVLKIEGSVALVTGANRGLGKALVSALVEAGVAKVYAAARDERKLFAGSSRVVPLGLDTANPEQIAAAARKAPDVTLLINNAGALNSYDVLSTSQADLDADFRTKVHKTRDPSRPPGAADGRPLEQATRNSSERSAASDGGPAWLPREHR